MTLHPKLESDTHFIAELTLSQLRLMNTQSFPWLILVPKVENAVELIDLNAEQQQLLLKEINDISHLLKNNFKPDKINIGTLGNIVKQLHIHVVGRYETDPAWPGPVWGYSDQPYAEGDLNAMIEKIRYGLSSTF